MARDPASVAQKWQRNLSQSTQGIRDGVMSVTVSPTQQAAASVDRMVAGIQRAAAEGKIQRGLQRVSLQQWQDAMTNKGLPRIASGAAAAVPKMQSFMSQWLPHMDALKNRLASMPRGDLSQNIARMVAAVEHAASFRRT